MEGSGQFLNVGEGSFHKADKLFPVGKLHVFLTEVKFQLKQGSHLKELSPQTPQFL